MIKRPFEQWLYEDVELVFGLERIEDLPALQTWLEVSNPLPLTERFEKLRSSLRKNVENWNEDELKTLFINPLFFDFDFDFDNPPHYRVFTQRLFTLQTPEVEATGRVGWFVATGKQTPKKPFFFLQEYKPEKNSGNDPLGQLLIAMVDAQIMNETTPSGVGGNLCTAAITSGAYGFL
jgi:hypothetical protein